MIALTQAARALGSWRLEKCALFVTLEPCPMCAGALVQARVPVVVFGCTDPKAGACQTLYQITSDPRLNHRCQVVGGVLADRCSCVLSLFFVRQRALGKLCHPAQPAPPAWRGGSRRASPAAPLVRVAPRW
jgi:tRNA(adenine34) deaminase